MSIAQEIQRIRQGLPASVELVAVSKFHPAGAIAEAYAAGQRVFGESRVQELLEKNEQLPADIRWHFIGHLQTNKAKHLIGKTDLIESVDSERLLGLLDRLSAERGVVTRVLLQVHVAQEETKFGFAPGELTEWLGRGAYRAMKNVEICGLMGMATNTDDEARIRADFRAIATLFRQIRAEHPDLASFSILSMGMTDDYGIAVEEGSNNVRIGSAIFGARHY